MNGEAEPLVLDERAGETLDCSRQFRPDRMRDLNRRGSRSHGATRIETHLGAVDSACAQAQRREHAVEVRYGAAADKRDGAVERAIERGQVSDEAGGSHNVAWPRGQIEEGSVHIEKQGKRLITRALCFACGRPCKRRPARFIHHGAPENCRIDLARILGACMIGWRSLVGCRPEASCVVPQGAHATQAKLPDERFVPLWTYRAGIAAPRFVNSGLLSIWQSRAIRRRLKQPGVAR